MNIYKVQFYEYNSYSYTGIVPSWEEYFKDKEKAEARAKSYVEGYHSEFGYKTKCPEDMIPDVEEIEVF